MKKRYLFVPLLLLLSLVCTPVWGQAELFTYEDAGATIAGLTDTGKDATVLTIPSTVTFVKADAFIGGKATTLIINGGNPAFGASVLAAIKSTLTLIDAGSGMSTTNIRGMLLSLGSVNYLATVEIGGYTDVNATVNWDDMTEVLTEYVQVQMPAALVADQVFGNAVVVGSFDLKAGQELATFCGSANFYDDNDGGNFLFYVPTKLEDGKVYIERVRIVMADKGVMMHNVTGTAQTVYLPRWDAAIPSAQMDLYNKNMLKGVKTATTIAATEGEGASQKTNFVLSNGAFHPTSGGTLGANKAYLQILTTEWNAIKGSTSRLELCFDDETALSEELRVKSEEFATATGWYSLDGRKLSDEPTQKGIYIHNGKKVVLH